MRRWITLILILGLFLAGCGAMENAEKKRDGAGTAATAGEEATE